MMRLAAVAPALSLCLLLACSPEAAEPEAVPAEPVMESDEDKTLYALGLAIARNLSQFKFSDAELALIKAGLTDGAQGREPRVPLEEFGPRIDVMLRGRTEAMAEKEKEAGAAYLGEMAQEAGATTTESGLVYRELEPGEGANPSASDTVRLHYHGTLRDGSVFDSSREKTPPTPATFALNAVVPCFGEGVQKMKVGGKSKLTCPPELAYGDRGSPPAIPPGATLTFEVELLEIVQQPAAAPGAP